MSSGRTDADVAESLGVAQSCLYGWRSRDLIDRGLKPPGPAAESSALQAAQARIRDLEDEVKILRKDAAAVQAVVPPNERFALVAELADEGVQVQHACRVLGVSRSGFYEWRIRAPSARAIRHAWLSEVIAAVHQDSRETYGRLRVHAELVQGQGVTVGHNTIGLLMRRAGLAGLPTRRRPRRPHLSWRRRTWWAATSAATDPTSCGSPTSPSTPPGTARSTAVVLDAWSRRVVGWSIDTRQTADLATHAPGMAIDTRDREKAQTIIHGDHGTQFTSWAFTSRARQAGLLPSLGSVGDPYDNAMIESFWGRMQTELLNRQRWSTRVELANAIFEYIEGFHNRRRRHSALDFRTPIEFENTISSSR